MTAPVREQLAPPAAGSAGPDLGAVANLATRDAKSARLLIGAEQTRTETQARIAAADAEAARQLHVAQERQRLAAEGRATRQREADEAEARKAARRAAAKLAKQQRQARRRAWRQARWAYVRSHGDAVYAGLIYGMAVGGAVYGQITAATARGWPLVVGLVIATAIEGLALVMALTANKLRLDGEAARAPRALTWACAATAAAINYLGHLQARPGDEAGAVLLALLSMAGIVVWEIRSGAKHRKTLRALGLLPQPAAAFGWRRWVRYPASTAAAWSVDIRDRLSPRGRHLLQVVLAERHARRVAAERERVRQLAAKAVRTAAKAGDTGAVLASLVWLAEHGTPRPVLTLTTAPSGVQLGDGDGLDPASVPTPVPTPVPMSVPVPVPAPDLGDAVTEPRTGAPTDLRNDAAAQVRTDEVSTTALGSTESDLVPEPVPALDVPATTPSTPVSSPSQAPPAPPAKRVPAKRVPAKRTTAARTTAKKTVTARAVPDVADLMEPGRKVWDRLAAAGVALTRTTLIDGLRADEVPVSTTRAGALLAALNDELRA